MSKNVNITWLKEIYTGNYKYHKDKTAENSWYSQKKISVGRDVSPRLPFKDALAHCHHVGSVVRREPPGQMSQHLPQLQTAVPPGAFHILRHSKGNRKQGWGQYCIQSPHQVGWGLLRPASWFGFFLCLIWYLSPSFHSGWSLTHILHPKLHHSVYFWGTQPTTRPSFVVWLNIAWHGHVLWFCLWVGNINPDSWDSCKFP